MSATILVIDEDPDLQELIIETLEVAGYTAIGAESSQDALTLLRQRRFDIVIAQVRETRRKSDVTNLELLRQKSPGLLCIVISQHDTLEHLQESFRNSIEQFVFKPLQMPAILDAVRRLTSQARSGNPLWTALMSVPQKLLRKADAGRRENALQSLQTERHKTLRALHAGVKSEQLSKGAALDVWDRLVRLEREADGLATLEEGARLTEVQALATRYRQLSDLMGALARSKSEGTFSKRAPEDVDRATFQRFYDRMRCNRILPEQMEWAWSAWNAYLSPSAGDERGRALSQIMWGEEKRPSTVPPVARKSPPKEIPPPAKPAPSPPPVAPRPSPAPQSILKPVPLPLAEASPKPDGGAPATPLGAPLPQAPTTDAKSSQEKKIVRLRGMRRKPL